MVVIVTAFLVGGSTILGALLGFCFKTVCRRFAGAVMGFAAGVMLFSALTGLIQPALGYGGHFTVFAVLGGIFCGGLFLGVAERLLPEPDASPPKENQRGEEGTLAQAGLLFVLAIALHNLPEGAAAGVGLGADDPFDALFVALGIALQNLPEGMLVVAPLLAAGYSKKKTFLLAALTGIIEIVGTFLGFFAVRITFILPFALSFAGGTMLFIIVDQMLPLASKEDGTQKTAYAFLLGVSAMLIGTVLLS
ncbi:MAG: ZIP family metal transporter [Clostridia bacterium]|nr:ZIP family metal transporter [Clostridia bacterium]